MNYIDISHNLKPNEFIFGKDLNDILANIDTNFRRLLSDISLLPSSNLVFHSTEDVSISNTNVETTAVGDGEGSNLIPSELLVVGKSIHLKLLGYISTDSVSTDTTLRVKLGGVTIISNLGTLPKSLIKRSLVVDVAINVRGENLVTLSGHTIFQSTTGISTSVMRSLVVDNPVSVDLSEDCLVDLTYQWAVAHADNSLVLTNLLIYSV